MSLLHLIPFQDQLLASYALDGLQNLTNRINLVIALFQAIGGFIVAYILFNIVNIVLSRKKNSELKQIRLLLEKINKKLGNNKK